MAVIIVAVSVPGLLSVVQVVYLYETNSGFTKATSQEATLRKLGAPVAFMDVFRLLGNIKNIGCFGLHGVGEFHGTDLRIEFGVLLSLFEMNLVEGIDEVELVTLLFSGKVRVVEIRNEFFHFHIGGVDCGSLVFSWKEAIGPELRPDNRSAGSQGNIAGQVFVFGSKPIRNPTSDGWPNGLRIA